MFAGECGPQSDAVQHAFFAAAGVGALGLIPAFGAGADDVY